METARMDQIFEDVVATIREPLLVLDSDLKVISANRSFINSFKATREETLGNFIYDLGNKQWDIPQLRELLEIILPEKTSFDNYEVEHDFTTIGRRVMLLNARQIERAMGKERIILLAIEDITERREIENGLKKAHEELKGLNIELKRAAQVKSEFLANMSHELRTPLNSINGFSEAVISSLWSVSDISTSLLMRKMYELINKGRGKAESLREAQLWLKDPGKRQEHNEMFKNNGNENRKMLFDQQRGFEVESVDWEDFLPDDLHRPYHWAGFLCSGVS